MRTRLIRLRFRRQLRKSQRQVEDLSIHAEKQIERHLFKRFGHLAPVRRFVLGWTGLIVLIILALVIQNLALSGYYQTTKAVPGGVYNEGVVGRFTNANPLYANNEADATVSRLIFSGLFTYNEKGKLVGDLAKDYKVSDHGATYTVNLKPNLTWHDGKPLTSSDVVFTYQLIQNPDTHSPLQSSWQGIEVTAPNDRTVVFKLPGVLAAFPYNMTNGLLPKHLLSDINPADMRSADFNTVRPVGAGPFVWQAIKVEGDGAPKNTVQQIGLAPFVGYQSGKPKLQQFVVHVYGDKSQLTEAFKGGQLTAAQGLNSVPPELKDNESVIAHSILLRAADMVFFKTSSGVLAGQPVRRALVQSANVPEIIKSLDYPTRPVVEPFLVGQVGYDKAYTQPKFDPAAAKATLESDGWQMGNDGVRSKGQDKLSFSLTAPDDPESRMVTDMLKKDWKKVGAKVDVQALGSADFQNSLIYHSYDAILNGITIGVDPDVFVYWDSAQADIRAANRLNFSEYKNTPADAALEAGRTRIDPALRDIKYKPFLEAWQKDNPALGLYQPRNLYLTRGNVSGLTAYPISSPVDRLSNVQNWQIREAKVSN